MSVRWRATWFSSSRPLPPSRSRASLQIHLPFCAVAIFTIDAWASVSWSRSASSAMRLQSSCMVGQLAEHVGQARLHELVAGDRVAELHGGSVA